MAEHACCYCLDDCDCGEITFADCWGCSVCADADNIEDDEPRLAMDTEYDPFDRYDENNDPWSNPYKIDEDD